MFSRSLLEIEIMYPLNAIEMDYVQSHQSVQSAIVIVDQAILFLVLSGSPQHLPTVEP